MKKIIIAAALTACAAAVTAQTVTSANIVGYSKQAVGAGTFLIMANQFVNDDEASVTIDEAFGTTLPEDSELYMWTGTGYAAYGYYSWNGGWTDANTFAPAGDVVIMRGDSLWVKNAGGTSVDMIFSGNVPQSGSTTNTLFNGFTLVANPYPTAVRLDDLNINPAEDDEVYLWDGSAYVPYGYYSWNGGWTDANTFAPAGTVSVPVGVGFWYKTTTPREWVMPIPYTVN